MIENVTVIQMSITSPNATIKFSPFHAILQDGIDRLLELIPNEEFTFIVKGEELKITLFGAVLISPILSERLKTDPPNHEFNLESDEIKMKQFSSFVDFIRNREEFNFSREDEIVILSICKLLGNEKLSLLILGCFPSGISIKSFSSNECESESESSEMQNICKISIEDCASKFNSYSTAELENISKHLMMKGIQFQDKSHIRNIPIQEKSISPKVNLHSQLEMKEMKEVNEAFLSK
jgi:hypothetical protein